MRKNDVFNDIQQEKVLKSLETPINTTKTANFLLDNPKPFNYNNMACL